MTAPTPEERAENACEAGGIAPTGAACAAIAAEIRAAVEAERVLGAYAYTRLSEERDAIRAALAEIRVANRLLVNPPKL